VCSSTRHPRAATRKSPLDRRRRRGGKSLRHGSMKLRRRQVLHPLARLAASPQAFAAIGFLLGERCTVKKSGDALGDLHNVVLHLQFHPDWLGVLAFDQFGEAITKLRPPPYVDGCVGEWRDLDDAETLHWLSDYMAEPTAATVRTAVLIVANRSKFNKVRDYLEACALAWDGVSRLETWLIDFMGVCRGARFDAMPENDRARTLAYVRLRGRSGSSRARRARSRRGVESIPC
jgi:hypothetical protein